VSAFRSGATRANFEKMAGSVFTVSGVTVPFNRLTVLPDELVAAVLPSKIASTVLMAKKQDNGLKAASLLNGLEEGEQLKVLELLTDSASV
jgi:hypothetical protein